MTKTTITKNKRNLVDIQKELGNKGELINKQMTITPSENRLGQTLVDARIKVIPQFNVGNRSFDFKIYHYPILIEVDGGIHNTPEKRIIDYRKDRFVQRRGFKVLRFTNGEIHHNLLRVVNEIKSTIKYVAYQPREVILYPISIKEQMIAFFRKIRGRVPYPDLDENFNKKEGEK